MALFGSRARGDYGPTSDIDILLWTDGGRPETRSIGDIALSLYPRGMLLDLAGEGDLFLAHLVKEAVAVWDPLDLLGEIRRSYRPNQDLDRVVANATDLGLLLLERERHFPPELFNRRAAWVARTIMIARSAQRGETVFSARGLARLLDSPDGLALVETKGLQQLEAGTPAAMRRFLKQFGIMRGAVDGMIDFRTRFAATANSFGIKTLNQLESLEPQTIYA